MSTMMQRSWLLLLEWPEFAVLAAQEAKQRKSNDLPHVEISMLSAEEQPLLRMVGRFSFHFRMIYIFIVKITEPEEESAPDRGREADTSI